MQILFLSHSAEVGVFRVGSHHLSRELAAAGHAVAHVSTPVTAGHLGRVSDAGVRERLALATRPRSQDGVRHLVAAAPLPLRFGAANHRAVASHLRTRLGRAWLRDVDVVFVDQALFGPVIARVAPAARVVYRPTDAHDPVTPIGRAETQLMLRADGVVATSEPVLDSLGPRAREVPFMILENGVELARFASIAVHDVERGGDVVYVGALDHRFDWNAVAQIAGELPGVTIDLIGPVPADAPSGLPTNVVLRGPVAYAELPATLAPYRVGLLPLNDAPVNIGRSPMKYFEYLASGLQVVARSTPALERLAAPGVVTFDRAEHAAMLVAAALEAGPNSAGRDYAADYDWAARAARLAHFADQLLAQPVGT